MEIIDFIVEPKEDLMKVAKPTSELIQRILATIKYCQENNLDYFGYEKLVHDMVETFIKTPMEV